MDINSKRPGLVTKAKAMQYLKKALSASVPMQMLDRAVTALTGPQQPEPQTFSPYGQAMGNLATEKERLERAMRGEFD